jgi:protoheme IX farnesyltransferase
VVHSLALLAVGLLPTTLHLAGALYFVTAFVLGLAMIICGAMLARSYSRVAARRLLIASLIYLPALLTVMAVDKVRV